MKLGWILFWIVCGSVILAQCIALVNIIVCWCWLLTCKLKNL